MSITPQSLFSENFFDQSHCFLNPRLSRESKQRFEALAKQAAHLKAHVLLCTSGTSSAKLVALSKKAILISAQTVNEWIHATKQDRWLLVLPFFHISGISILARAWLSNSEVVDYYQTHSKWDPKSFVSLVQSQQISLTSLVPTQIYDIVRQQLQAPSVLRAVFVGGDYLSPELYHQARLLGWPLIPCYGMTETGAQIASASMDSFEGLGYPSVMLYPHINAKIVNGCLAIQSEGLLTGYCLTKNGDDCFFDPKVEGWFVTDDQVKLKGRAIHCLGRKSHTIKISGELVDLPQLNARFDSIKHQEATFFDSLVVARKDPRLGYIIALLVETGIDAPKISTMVRKYNDQVLPFERIQSIDTKQALKKSATGKIIEERVYG